MRGIGTMKAVSFEDQFDHDIQTVTFPEFFAKGVEHILTGHKAISNRNQINESASTSNDMAIIQEPIIRTPTFGHCFRVASDV
jgi:hypothetical protein